MSAEVLAAQGRNLGGKGASRKLRREGTVPCIIYGDQKGPIMAAVNEKVITKQSTRHDFFSHVLDLSLAGSVFQVIPKAVQYHPVSDKPLHIDFLRISKTSEIRLHIPLEFINEDKSPALKLGALLNIVQRSIEVLCSPLSIPEKFEIDLKGAALGTTFTVGQLALPQGCRLPGTVHSEAVLANIVQPSQKVEEETSSGPEAATPAEAAKATA
ncbi:50S ribosomal protein L25 [Alphaproteobacteria bacterium]|nr:50S ribosomal protein L25 [Alphaproteobacteria bacterium]GHS98679.1 50S ribosomal protein L25 [Alphaproteobacteria bacterium]